MKQIWGDNLSAGLELEAASPLPNRPNNPNGNRHGSLPYFSGDRGSLMGNTSIPLRGDIIISKGKTFTPNSITTVVPISKNGGSCSKKSLSPQVQSPRRKYDGSAVLRPPSTVPESSSRDITIPLQNSQYRNRPSQTQGSSIANRSSDQVVLQQRGAVGHNTNSWEQRVKHQDASQLKTRPSIVPRRGFNSSGSRVPSGAAAPRSVSSLADKAGAYSLAANSPKAVRPMASPNPANPLNPQNQTFDTSPTDVGVMESLETFVLNSSGLTDHSPSQNPDVQHPKQTETPYRAVKNFIWEVDTYLNEGKEDDGTVGKSQRRWSSLEEKYNH